METQTTTFKIEKYLVQRTKLRNLAKEIREEYYGIQVSLNVPLKHYNAIRNVAALLECTPKAVLQKCLNQALKTGTLGHVLESMLNEKYYNVFNNTHDLDLK